MTLSALIDFAVSTSIHGSSPWERQWRPEEDDFIRAHITTLTVPEIGQQLGRTKAGIQVHMKRSGMAPASKHPGWLTTNQVAKILRADCHSITELCRRGILPYVRLPGLHMTKSIRTVTFYRWAINPMNWIYFHTERVRDPHLRRLIELRRERWGDDWWTTGQMAEHYGLASSNSIEARIKRGTLNAVRWGNWYILRSVALAQPIYPSRGGNRKYMYWSPGADAWLLRARDELGLEWAVIARMMKWPEKRAMYRYKSLVEHE